VTLLLGQVRHGPRRGYQRMLEAFWDEARDFGLELPCDQPVSAQAFSAARRKLPAEVVRELVHEASDAFDREHGQAFRWHGRRLLAVDGKRLDVQASDELRRTFGEPTGAHYPQIHISTLFDVCAKVPLDVEVGRYGSDERVQLSKLLGRTRAGDVLVGDRGYPSFDLIVMLLESDLDFVLRVPAKGSFKAVEEFVATGATEGEVVLHPPQGSCLRGLDPIRLRVVRSDHGKETWVLLTTLPADEFPAQEVVAAYGLRWQVECFYDLLEKDYFEQGLLHARWADGVCQEVCAQMLFVLIARHVAAQVAKDNAIPPEELSRKGSVLAVADHLVRLLLHRPPDQARGDLRRLLERVARARYRPRPGRSYPRRSFKPQPRWGPSGRRGEG